MNSTLSDQAERIAELIAADEVRVRDISRLTVERDASRAECEGLRAALEPFAAFAGDEYDDVPNVIGVALIFDNDEELGAIPFGCFRSARAALSQKETGDAA